MPRRRQRSHWGTVIEVTPGKKYGIRWTEDTPQGRRKRYETFYGTRRQAEARKDEIHVEAMRREDELNAAKPLTMREVWDGLYTEWSSDALANGRITEGTLEGYRREWRNRICPRWGDEAAASIDGLSYQRWLSSMSPGTAKLCHKVVKRMFGLLVKYTDERPKLFADGTTYDLPVSGGGRSKEVLDISKACGYLEKLHGTSLELPFVLCMFGGMRTGESLGVRVEDVERVEHEGMVFAAVDVRRQMALSGDEPRENLKNPQSVRTTVVPPPWSSVVLEASESMRAVGTPWLCDRGDGVPMNRGLLNSRWTYAAESRGLHKIPFGNLRNSWRTSNETELRLPWNLLEMMMGHKLPGVSGANYIRPDRESVVRWACEEYAKSSGLRQFLDSK